MVDKVVVTLNVGFIDIQTGSDPKQVLNLGETSNTFIRIQVSNYLDLKRIRICHFCAHVWPLPHLYRFDVYMAGESAVAVKSCFRLECERMRISGHALLPFTFRT